jgi:predicted NUDIX family phosphoesterase
MNEDVMVVETSDLRPFITGRTFDLIRERTDEVLGLIESAHFFVPRVEAERSPQYRQIIPYVVVTHGKKVFTMRRTNQQNESRLHEKVSIGVGGHINPGHNLLAGLKKELEEEIAVPRSYGLDFLGILNDESTEVSRVHLGVVYMLRSRSSRVRVRETEKMTGSWVAREELGAMRDAMESWSQIVFDEAIAPSLAAGK